MFNLKKENVSGQTNKLLFDILDVLKSIDSKLDNLFKRPTAISPTVLEESIRKALKDANCINPIEIIEKPIETPKVIEKPIVQKKKPFARKVKKG